MRFFSSTLISGFRIMENMEDTEAFQRLGAHINLLFDECKGQVRPRYYFEMVYYS